MKKILFTAEYDDSQLDKIKALGDVHIDGWAKGIGKLPEEKLKELVKDANFLITSYDDINKEVIDAGKNLELIACTRATPVNVDVDYAKSKGITVIYTPGRNSDSTAEHTIALMLSISRKIPMAYKALKDHKFTGAKLEKSETKAGLRDDVIWDMTADSPYVVFKGQELKNKTLGIVGYGSIGKRVGNIARAFGMNILIYDPYVSGVDVNGIGVHKVSLNELLEKSDYVTVHLKVTNETKGLFNKKAFEKMKSTAYFINCARAAVVNEADLIDALRNKTIAGAALDVFEVEPIYDNHPFITELDNVVITPHIAGATTDAIINHTLMIIEDVERYLNNEKCLFRI